MKRLSHTLVTLLLCATFGTQSRAEGSDKASDTAEQNDQSAALNPSLKDYMLEQLYSGGWSCECSVREEDSYGNEELGPIVHEVPFPQTVLANRESHSFVFVNLTDQLVRLELEFKEHKNGVRQGRLEFTVPPHRNQEFSFTHRVIDLGGEPQRISATAKVTIPRDAVSIGPRNELFYLVRNNNYPGQNPRSFRSGFASCTRDLCTDLPPQFDLEDWLFPKFGWQSINDDAGPTGPIGPIGPIGPNIGDEIGGGAPEPIHGGPDM